jgi:hypothetical protein
MKFPQPCYAPADMPAGGADAPAPTEALGTETAAPTDSLLSTVAPPADEQQGAADAAKDEGKGDETKTEETKDDKPAVPEAYDLKAPDGMELDTVLLEQFTPLAKEFGLTNEAAQKLTDIYAGRVQQMQEQQAQRIAALHADWVGKVKADAEYGGDALDQNLALGKLAMEKIGTPELVKALNETGAGNHPEVVRFFVRVGKAMQTDGLVTGKGQAPADPLAKLYPSMVPTT